jgi:CsoR family transcriptional regulator, copper-sensing transcriptional repressor
MPGIPYGGMIVLTLAPHKKRKEVMDRLARIEGHVRGLRRMVEEDKDCPELLIQVAAVRAALNQVGRIMLEDHMETCVLEAAKEGKSEKAVAELKDALVKFINP